MRNNAQIESIILPVVEALGYELWTCFYLLQGQRRVFRIYIDSPKGITLGDCEKVSRQVSIVLDAEVFFKDRYYLEVSSPGLDRPLVKKEHYQRFIGYNVRICTRSYINNRRKLKGLLLSVGEEGVLLSENGKEFKLTWDNIVRTNVLPNVN